MLSFPAQWTFTLFYSLDSLMSSVLLSLSFFRGFSWHAFCRHLFLANMSKSKMTVKSRFKQRRREKMATSLMMDTMTFLPLVEDVSVSGYKRRNRVKKPAEYHLCGDRIEWRNIFLWIPIRFASIPRHDSYSSQRRRRSWGSEKKKEIKGRGSRTGICWEKILLLHLE